MFVRNKATSKYLERSNSGNYNCRNYPKLQTTLTSHISVVSLVTHFLVKSRILVQHCLRFIHVSQ